MLKAENGILLLHNSPEFLTEGEEKALDIIYSVLKEFDIESANIHVERRSENYLSLVAFEHYDFIRFKIGKRSKWISVSLSPTDRITLAEDKRFFNVKNKRQLHWKTELFSVEYLENCKDLIQRAYHNAERSYSMTWNCERTKK